jgi:ADP-dependent NAD(P)H-hydrate dehydratase / NAD(P)H-hydrate epimerase
MRAGAGTVILCTPESVYPVLARKLTEVMVAPMPETGDGTLAAGSIGRIGKHIGWADAVVLGPGLGRHPETAGLVEELLRIIQQPMVLDADGLTNLSGNLALLKNRKSKELVITPHVGELSRLINVTGEQIEANRIEISTDTANRLKLVLLLKGAPTVIADPKGNTFINPTGNPAMATAGSGDVLSGILGALLSQKTGALQSAWAGAWLHGTAGDLAAGTIGERGVLATDISALIPEVFRNLMQAEHSR